MLTHTSWFNGGLNRTFCVRIKLFGFVYMVLGFLLSSGGFIMVVKKAILSGGDIREGGVVGVHDEMNS